MKILVLIGSPRKMGNTHLITQEILSNLDENNFTSETIFLKDLEFKGCISCHGCMNSTTCVLNDDMQEIYQKMQHSDLLILASPTYYYNVTSDMKKLIDRFFCLNIFDENDRSIWTSYNHIHGKKAGIVVSVCEQNNYEDLGFTTDAMKRPMEDIGYDVIYTLEALKAFKKGDVLNNKVTLGQAKECAQVIRSYFK